MSWSRSRPFFHGSGSGQKGRLRLHNTASDGAGQKNGSCSIQNPASGRLWLRIFLHSLARKWRKLVPFYFRATATAPFFFTFATPFSVGASGAVALKVAQVPSTAHDGTVTYTCMPNPNRLLQICIVTIYNCRFSLIFSFIYISNRVF